MYGRLKFNFGWLVLRYAYVKMSIGPSHKFWDDVCFPYLHGTDIFEKEWCTTL